MYGGQRWVGVNRQRSETGFRSEVFTPNSSYNKSSYPPLFKKGYRPKMPVTLGKPQPFLTELRRPKDTRKPASKNAAPT